MDKIEIDVKELAKEMKLFYDGVEVIEGWSYRLLDLLEDKYGLESEIIGKLDEEMMGE